MTLGALGAAYLGAGVAIALVAAGLRRLPSATDALLLVGMWPLWAPLLLAHGRAPRAADPRERELLDAIARAQASPLAAVLPDAAAGRALAARLREAGARLAELDAVLARPDFDPAAAERRAAELTARRATAAAATAQLRVRTLARLRALRARYRAELDEVHEGIAQLVAQAELVRLQPAIAPAAGEQVRELLAHLGAQLEGLEELFAAQLAEYAPPGPRS